MVTHIIHPTDMAGIPTQYSPARRVGRDPSGVLWCCYSDHDGGGTYQIYVSYSTDEGETWTEEAVTTAAAGDIQQNPSFTPDSTGAIHVVWEGEGIGIAVGNRRNIGYRRRAAGGAWDAELALSNLDNYQTSPNIAIDGLDTIHIAWRGRGWGVNVVDYNIQYRNRTIAGVWDPVLAAVPTGITDNSENQLTDTGTLAVDSANTLHIVWSGLNWGVNVGDYNLQYRSRSAAGVWTPLLAADPTGLTDLAFWQHMSCIAIDSNDNLHVAFYAEWGFGAIWDIFYLECIAGVWQAVVQLTFTAGAGGWDDYQPSISVDAADNIHIVWYGNGYGANPMTYDLLYIARGNGTWLAVVILSDTAIDQYNPILLSSRWPANNITTLGFELIWTNILVATGTQLTYMLADLEVESSPATNITR